MSSWTGERHEPRVRALQERRHRCELEAAADDGRRRGGNAVPVARRGRGGRVEGRILAEDPLFEGAQLGRRLEPELVEGRASVAVGGERVCLPSRPVEGEHLLRAKAFAMWMPGDQSLELGGDLGMPAGLEVGVDPRLERGEPPLVEARGFRLRKGLGGDVREGVPPPERERVGGPARGDELLETLDVELTRRDDDGVPRRPREDPVDAERASERVDVHLKGVLRARGWRLPPDAVDQPVDRDRLVRVEQQQRQQRPRPRPTERHGGAVLVAHLQRAEDPEAHQSRSPSLVVTGGARAATSSAAAAGSSRRPLARSSAVRSAPSCAEASASTGSKYSARSIS